MNKNRLFFDVEKEIKWLNSMSEEGWKLVGKYFLTYEFKKCEPNQYIYQIEKRQLEWTKEDNDYIHFLEDLGIELVGRSLGYCYFQKENDGRKFEIYTDSISRIGHYKRIISTLLIIAIINIGIINSHFTEPSGPWILNISVSFTANIICLIAIIWTCVKYGRKMMKLKKEEILQE